MTSLSFAVVKATAAGSIHRDALNTVLGKQSRDFERAFSSARLRLILQNAEDGLLLVLAYNGSHAVAAALVLPMAGSAWSHLLLHVATYTAAKSALLRLARHTCVLCGCVLGLATQLPEFLPFDAEAHLGFVAQQVSEELPSLFKSVHDTQCTQYTCHLTQADAAFIPAAIVPSPASASDEAGSAGLPTRHHAKSAQPLISTDDNVPNVGSLIGLHFVTQRVLQPSLPVPHCASAIVPYALPSCPPKPRSQRADQRLHLLCSAGHLPRGRDSACRPQRLHHFRRLSRRGRNCGGRGCGGRRRGQDECKQGERERTLDSRLGANAYPGG